LNCTSTSSVPRSEVLKLAIPIMLANVSVPLVGIVDTAVMGQMPDPAYIGATAIGATIFSSVFWLFGFLRMGTGGLVAQAYGAGNSIETRHSIQRALIIGGVFGGAIILLQIPIFALSQIPFTLSEQLQKLTQDYFFVRIYSAPATLMLYGILGGLIGLQRMKSVMATQLVLNILNVALTLFFFFELDWGIKGVALASVLSDYVTLGLGFVLLRGVVAEKPLVQHDKSLFDINRWRRLLEVNSNLFVRTLCLIVAFYWLTAASSHLGVQILAANTLLIQMLHFMAHALDGFAHSAEALGGQAIGKCDRKRFSAVTRSCAEWGAVFSLIFALVYLFLGPEILRLMTTIDSVVSVSEQYLLWIAIAPLITVWGFLLDGIFIGATETRTMRNGMLVSLAIFAASSLILIPFMANHGLWLSYYLLMLSRAITLGLAYPNLLKKMCK